MKYWKNLLLGWRSQGKTGLSIPFILGSQNYLPSSHNRQDLTQLFVDMATSGEIKTYLSYCYIINDFILAVSTNDHQPKHGFFPSFQNRPQNKLFVSKFLDLGTDIESICLELNERLEYFILHEQYSINEGHRGEYSSEEIKFITESFASHF